MDPLLIQASLLLAGVAILGALLPMLGTWSDRSLHLLLSFAAGVFLGALFLELLPELTPGDGGGWLSSRLPWAAALAALLLLFFLEHIWLRERAGRAGRHLVVWLGTFTGLTTHAFVVGLGLSTLATKPGVLQPFVMTLAIHKAAESFSLATVMRLAELPARRAWSWMGVFVLATPVGIFLGLRLQPAEAGPGSLGPVLQGLAAGTFLYVAAYNLLPEVFHGHEQRRSRVLGLLAGLAVFSLATPH
jgi:zinc transporter ZupT